MSILLHLLIRNKEANTFIGKHNNKKVKLKKSRLCLLCKDRYLLSFNLTGRITELTLMTQSFGFGSEQQTKQGSHIFVMR